MFFPDRGPIKVGKPTESVGKRRCSSSSKLRRPATQPRQSRRRRLRRSRWRWRWTAWPKPLASSPMSALALTGSWRPSSSPHSPTRPPSRSISSSKKTPPCANTSKIFALLVCMCINLLRTQYFLSF